MIAILPILFGLFFAPCNATAQTEGTTHVKASWKCHKCGRFNIDGVNSCPYCGSPKKR
ncbi:MAG: hypothetical protein K0U13_04830 [Chlamydiae bacterium]|nr:hypothetical protein [Chlamydiota bacterium]